MPNDLLKATAGVLDIGVDEFSPDMSPEINLDSESENLTSGVYRGLGPRFGMAPMAGQSSTTASLGNLNNIRKSETVIAFPSYSSAALNNRKKLYAIYPIKLASYENLKVLKTYYFWVMGVENSELAASAPTIDLFFNSNFTAGSPDLFPITDDIRDGFPTTHQNFYAGGLFPDWYVHTSLVSNAFVQSVATATNVKPKAVARFLLQDSLPNFISSASFNASGRIVPMKWLAGKVTTASTSTRAPNVNYCGTEDYFLNFGQPSDYQLGNFRLSKRAIKTFTFYTDPSYGAKGFGSAHSLEFVSSTDYIKSVSNYNGTDPHLDVDSLTATRDAYTAPVGSQAERYALVNDNDCVMNTSYQAILAAGKRPLVWLLQPWLRNPNGIMTQYVDLASNPFKPTNYLPTATPYTENGTPTASCFARFPPFVRGTAMVSTYQVSLTTTTGTGLLRSNSVYEFAYSLYNKRLDFESNVGTPVKFQTGATDFVALQLWTSSGAGAVCPWVDSAGYILDLIPVFGTAATVSSQTNTENFAMNETEYRFYYRREGSFEWLPALFVDVPQFWFYPYWYTGANGLRACQSPIAALPGGQPGGFVDYSFLPDDTYNCVVNYKNRIWWFSSSAVYFSLPNNLFNYPTRNSISSRTGNFKGGLVHNYPGQAEQSSRLLIFGTTEVYVARFTGNLDTSPVQVSDNTIGEYPVDASDLIVDTWTTSTAFSFRSAVIAEGLAYWWGPTGIYRDDGVNTPKKISLRLEPDINTVYDPSDTDNIFASYNEVSKEITWYYKPRNAGSSETKGITWNIIDEEFLPQNFNSIIDNVFSVKIDTNTPTGGNRIVAISRNARTDLIQRPYFHDSRCQAGDMRPTRDLVVSTISSPTTGTRRLTIAPGYDATNFATIAVGDFISLDQVLQYATTMTAADRMLAKISAINTGTGTLDIVVPEGATIDASASLAVNTYFPIWHKSAAGVGLNGFNWRIKTKYWMPFGLNFFGNWLWLYIMHKLTPAYADEGQVYTIAYRTPTGGDFVTDTVVYNNNSDGNWQLYHALRTAQVNNQGQAIKFDMQGVQIASQLVLQFLEVHGTEDTGNNLKMFEG